MKTKKEFDCVEMKREAQRRIYEETKDMSFDELLAYWQEKDKSFKHDIELMKKGKLGRP